MGTNPWNGDIYRADVYQRDDGRWEWRLRHRNGQIVAVSGEQGYERVAGAKRSLARIAGAFRAGLVDLGWDP